MSIAEPDPDALVGTAEETATQAGEGEKETPKRKLDLDVQISDVGPCKKHVKVAIARSEIDRQLNESIDSMQKETSIPGFRPGRAPRQLIERRLHKQVSDQVKSTLLMACLEQLDEDYDLNPITAPELDVAAIELPQDGPMRFEMELEVRPDFALPAYKALTVHRPVKEITEADVDAQLTRFVERYAQLVPKLEGGAEIGDFVTTDLTFLRDGQPYNEVKEIQFRLQPELRFQDGSVPKLGEALAGVRPGEEREAEVLIGSGSVDASLRGQTIRVKFTVHDLKQLRLPEVNASFLSGIGFDSVDDLRQALREILERRLRAQQREAIRAEVLSKLLAETPFDLPADLVGRQEKSTIRRLVSGLQKEGLSESDIRAREAQIRANAHESTLRGLKEFFLLAKVAEAEDLKVEDEDLEMEIEAIAARTDESPRRVRARIEKEGLAETLASEILERKALDLILEFAKFEEVPLVEPQAVETLDYTATSSDGREANVEAAEDAEEGIHRGIKIQAFPANLRRDHPELGPTLDELERWLAAHQEDEYVDFRHLASDLPEVRPIELAKALSLLVERGDLSIEFGVLDPVQHRLARGNIFGSPEEIPDRLFDIQNNMFDADQGEIVAVYRGRD